MRFSVMEISRDGKGVSDRRIGEPRKNQKIRAA